MNTIRFGSANLYDQKWHDFYYDLRRERRGNDSLAARPTKQIGRRTIGRAKGRRDFAAMSLLN